ncbi:DJ-1/PfpI family protein-like protein [Mollisia scopiformis]|uniref:DJ-1/PfpI family protein-like protein n=1 Tax=Mollisia scopiformis TaxID=149040 RepID=A0A194X279_MOLSC|nr:DJ-1/PfpI family protein-like protein [Mollisia scopiformis]KUJ14278.1 DJ-1/PfpI family protein-like protein [Mollisia scopiformis]
MPPIQFGVLLFPSQTVDTAMPLDTLSSCSKHAISLWVAHDPTYAPLLAQAIDIEYHHIAPTLSPVPLTGGFKVLPSTTIAACPPLDFLLIGGPELDFQFSPEMTAFIQTHVAAGKGLFTNCTGALPVAATGVLDGRTATVNHEALEVARAKWPRVNWVREQWVVDGGVWTAGGACAGMDMMAWWVVERCGREVARLGFRGLDYVPRDVEGRVIVV